MHLITRISVIGIAITTMALVILVSAFNGIEGMVERLYSTYDAPLTVRSSKGKTFRETTVDLKKIARLEGISRVSRAVEETVILKHEKKWASAKLTGVDPSFLETCRIDEHYVKGEGGEPALEVNGEPTAIIGATLLDKIEGAISPLDGYEQIQLYTPLRDASIARRKSPFKTEFLKVVCRMNYNREINAQYVMVPLEFAQQQLSYDGEITALYIGVKEDADPFDVKERVQRALGKDFVVKTAAEKNELIFQTSRSEKRIVVIILVFVFILAAFNLVASLTMLYIEKKENIVTMMHFGAGRGFVFRIFFFEGLMIAAKGIFFGIVAGVVACLTQYYGQLLEMPNTGGEAFPIAFTVADGLMIVGLVSALSIVTSFLPVYYMVRRTVKND